ncbi:AGC/AKT protein kinase [Favolaschia claudopus]|uniref:AGC/AKT protein kinase n=1 Tax=Favolaschia claudopus TaxID=2862362 RepID=A0AAW0DXN3_9AGAR
MAFGEQCDSRGSTTTLTTISSAVPHIDIDSLDMIPFSESFSGLLEGDDDGDGTNDDDYEQRMKSEMSYDVEQFSNIMDVDPEWDDDDVAEIMFLSPKQQRYSTLPTITEELSMASNEASSSLISPQEPEEPKQAVSLADFDIIPTTDYPMLCRRRSSNKVYVIKALNSHAHAEESVMESLRALCPIFVEHVSWTFSGEEGRIYLVSETHSNENLATLVQSSGPLSHADTLFYACEIVEGLTSLHTAHIVHRNLTPFNIFLDSTGHLVLSNFSNATVLSIGTRCEATPSPAVEYQAPELVLNWGHDFAVDCWSFGVLLHFLLTGANPVVDAEDFDSFRSQILSGNIIWGDLTAVEPKDLIGKCLERNPALRLTIRRIKEHDYFASVDWQAVRQKNLSPPALSRTPSPKIRPTSQDFPLPPAPRISLSFDPSLDISFTLQTASKAIPFQSRLERIPDHHEILSGERKPSFRSSHSMEDLRSRRNAFKRLSLPSKSPSTSFLLSRRNSSVTSAPAVDVPSPDPPGTFSSRLSLPIQTPDLLPPIFRPTVLDERVVEEEEYPQPPSAITSPTICELSPRERMAQFWETLDDVEDQPCPSSVPPLELRDALKLALPCPPLPAPRQPRLRKCGSTSTIHAQEQRFSIFSATQATTNKLRKLRRPLSTPGLGLKRPEPIVDLPSGVEQIGRGIGFTYRIPVANHSKPSICTTQRRSVASKLLRSGLGIKKILRRARSQPAGLSSSGTVGRRRGPPPNIQTSPHVVGTVAPDLYSPVSDGPSTPDSFTFPAIPEITSDPFAKDEVTEEARDGGPTLRLVRVASSEFRVPFFPTMHAVDSFPLSSWNA